MDCYAHFTLFSRGEDLFKAAKKIINTLSTLLIVLVFIMAFLIAGVRLIGYTPYTVLSGSMEPTFHVGSLIYVKEVDPTTLKVGDPLTFTFSNGTIVTHKIIEVIEADNPSQLQFRTQGEANNTPDGEPVTVNRIIGKPAFTIPYLGFVSHFVQNPPGTYITVCFCVAILIFTFLPDFIPEEKDKKAELTEESEKEADEEK